MSTYYMDLENGNDSNDGSSWANAWKTFTNGATAARTAPGDTIRIAKTKGPTSLGVTTTFTERSRNITLSSALTANLDLCESAWTSDGGTDVVCTTSTDELNEGSYCVQNQIKAAFTTGLAAHKTISELNCSGYQNVSFYIYSSVEIPSGYLRLDLCSDDNGTTVVDSVTINRILKAGWKTPYVYKKGSALGSSIKSVALTVLTDLGASDVNIRLDNIIACNDLHHCTVIGKSGGPYLSVRSINDTAVVMGGHDYYNYDSALYWPKSTDTGVAVYVYEVALIYAISLATSDVVVQESGSAAGGQIFYSGGWNTGSTEIDGYTVIAPMYWDVGSSYRPYGISFNDKSFLKFSRICPAAFVTGAFYQGPGAADIESITLDELFIIGGNQSAIYTPSARNMMNWRLTGNITLWECIGGLKLLGYESYSMTNLNQDKDSVLTILISDNRTYLTLANGPMNLGGKVVLGGKASTYYETGLSLPSDSCNEIYIKELEINYCDAAIGISGGAVSIDKLTVTGGSKLVNQTGGNSAVDIRVGRYILSGGSPTELTLTSDTSVTHHFHNDRVIFDAYKADDRWKTVLRRGVISDHITGGQVAGWAYGGSGLSMLLDPNSATWPLFYKMKAVVAAEESELHMYVRKTSASANCKLYVSIYGAGCTPIQEEEVTLTDSWAEYVSTSFTPARAGLVYIILYAYDGSSTGDIGVDGISIEAV